MDNKQLATAQDIFDFGFLMLICAVGGLELFESSDFTEKLKMFLEELSKKPQERSKYCCLIHDEDLISSIKLPTPESTLFSNKPVKVVKNAGIVIDKSSKTNDQIRIQNVLLSSNFSKEFIDFLCSCLKFDPNQRASTKDLLHMPFLKHKECHGPSISLTEILKISHQWSKNFVLPPEYQGATERELNKLCEALSIVLPNCDSFGTSDDNVKDYSTLESLDADSPEIQELAADLGTSAEVVAKRIKQLLESLKDQSDGKENKKGYVY
jgi:serine/threonine protein kinase